MAVWSQRFGFYKRDLLIEFVPVSLIGDGGESGVEGGVTECLGVDAWGDYCVDTGELGGEVLVLHTTIREGDVLQCLRTRSHFLQW
jgi:hypothetical protein